jgi:NAD-dependent deacetylase
MNPVPAPGDATPLHFERFINDLAELAMRARLVVLTGAGVSAASGLPTFRGPEGWWTTGSHRHRPEELATRAFFARQPRVVWEWYLFRRTTAHRAAPNPAHRALAELAGLLGARLMLVTQNVDGLHRRAGSPVERTFEIHGNLDFMRCAAACQRVLLPVPDSLHPWSERRHLRDDEQRHLTCTSCRGWMRPHVLWFDEYYEEEWFRSESSLACMETADTLLVVGTSGATTLPLLMLRRAVERGIRVLVIDPESSPFSEVAGPEATLHLPSAVALPELVARLRAASAGG